MDFHAENMMDMRRLLWAQMLHLKASVGNNDRAKPFKPAPRFTTGFAPVSGNLAAANKAL